ncbi:hypothetical protein PAL_GLEAN10002131 [Pteropus alecto]|uniref:Uncharacterized protein n=1 Tax=Pteropus alecto TaxID=9402 RepID=L5KBE3_PTEAL|nr:hypothetical protein PAL_GLEAN10002131 [Pteropus alecto]
MTLYLTFPVAMFWIANQAKWFEDYVVQRKRELWPPEKEDQVSDTLFLPPEGQWDLGPCGYDGFNENVTQGTESRGACGSLTVLSLKDEADPHTWTLLVIGTGLQRRELEEFKERLRKQREEKLLRAAQQSS